MNKFKLIYKAIKIPVKKLDYLIDLIEKTKGYKLNVFPALK
jgi:hypothetical protein